MCREVALFAAGAVSLALLAGCGGETPTDVSQAGVGPNVGAPISLADCTDWNRATPEERLGTVGQLRRFTGGPVAGTGGSGVVLEDKEAYDLFQRYCAQDFARAFKLYKLYGRAAAFRPYAEQGAGAQDGGAGPGDGAANGE